MAALSEAPRLEVVDLSQLSGRDVAPLFSEEVDEWRRRFAWDFRQSAELLSRYIQTQSLFGFALRAGGELAGYTYFVCEGRKGLLGDFFVRPEYNYPSNELLLLSSAVNSLMRTAGIRRIESQLMLFRSLSATLPFREFLKRHDRLFMALDTAAIARLAPAAPMLDVSFVPWSERHSEDIAHLVSAAYKGHVDSEINEQYRSIPGARHFLTNIIRYPGCGAFTSSCSALAIQRRTGRVCGVCLASMVAPDSGHITQLCVLPALRGARLGYELIRRSLVLLRDAGCTSVSLTVTASNTSAIRLYESIGFEAKSVFPALVWEGF
jgi:ribosomal protein S18 acetylase RimI-like enzyme